MKDETNQNPPPEPTPVNSDEALAKAFADLICGSLASEGTRIGGSGDSCPGPEEWILVASGGVHSEKVDALLAHAAVCSLCAPRLRQSLRLFSADISSEEAAEIGNLASATASWQHRMSVELAHSPIRQARSARFHFYLWAGAAMAASITLAAGLTLWWQRDHAPEQLLAEAYTHSRSFDLRMPGADFAEVTPNTHLRGASGGYESPKLLDARSRIERQLEAAPNNQHWLQLEARADVLEENFDPAIDILDRLLADGPVTTSLLTDDASAYFQRGVSTGSENDRATALDDLRRADELAPGDPVVLFNEAVVMEDRGQLMNAVETWNRYLRFERDPKWLAEGRRRVELLQNKLNQLKSHQSRMNQHSATPQAMRALAANTAALATLDEEFSSTLLPRLLDSAFPAPIDRSRASPCDESCLAARTLLHALAASLERNHQDSWLTQLLPSDAAPLHPNFPAAAHALALAIDADVRGNFLAAENFAMTASQKFHALGNTAGEDRAVVERSYAQLLYSNQAGCYRAAHSLLGRNPQFAWIQIQAFTQSTLCDPAAGSVSEDNSSYLRAMKMAHDHGYTLQELRARNLFGSSAVDSGDSELSWHIYLDTVRKFYSGDYPALRLYTTLSGLAQVEAATPRTRLALLEQRETVSVLELSQATQLIPTERFKLASVAIRAGDVDEAQSQMRLAQKELTAIGGGASIKGRLAENEFLMANLYLSRRDLDSAAKMLDAARTHIAGEDNTYHRNDYAAAYGQLQLALGHPEAAEPMLRQAILSEEHEKAKGGSGSIAPAQQDRNLYAVLAGIWLAQGRSGEDILALWQRYRLRILGLPVPACDGSELNCLKPQVLRAIAPLGNDRIFGQVLLLDRTLIYQATAQGVTWSTIPVGQNELLTIARPLEQAVTSPASSQASMHQSARRIGDLLLSGLQQNASTVGQLLVESDPQLGNLPWPAVDTASGALGLSYNLEETPSLLLTSHAASAHSSAAGAALVVGASLAAGQSTLLPEVLDEARSVARFDKHSNLLIGAQATEPQFLAKVETASVIHFAGHAEQIDGTTRLLLAPDAAAPDHPYLDSALLRKHPPRAARLVVFSACSTGKKEEGWDHGMGEIVDTLASLGVPDVVATRWQIDSSAAVPLMDTFYSNLAQGLTVPRALTAARQSLQRDPRYRHPYYWAAFYASGAGKEKLSQLFHSTNHVVN